MLRLLLLELFHQVVYVGWQAHQLQYVSAGHRHDHVSRLPPHLGMPKVNNTTEVYATQQSLGDVQVLTGGHVVRHPSGGQFFAPTVLVDVTPDMRIWRLASLVAFACNSTLDCSVSCNVGMASHGVRDMSALS